MQGRGPTRMNNFMLQRLLS